MEIGKIFKTRLYVRGDARVHAWCVTCKNCKAMESGHPMFSKKSFIELIRHDGWFKVKGKWSCGRHGDADDGNVRDREWRVE
jgi:hypothetical protein